MRLRQIKKVLTEEIKNLNFPYAQIPNSNPARYKAESLNALRDGVTRIQSTGILNEEISNLRGSVIFGISSNEIQLNGNEVNHINGALNELRKLILGLINAFNEANIKDIEQEYLAIKLPKLTGFEELKEVSDKLKKSITIPVDDTKKGKVEISNFDTGSFWIDVAVGTSAAISIVSSIVWAGAVVYKKIQEARIFEQYANGLKAKIEHIEGIVDLAQKEIDLVIDAEANHLYSEHYAEDDDKAEKIERLKLSIKSMSELISKGTEVHASLSAPEEIKNLFPHYSALNLIESKIKQIENK